MAQPTGKHSGLPLLSGHYNQGYTDALLYLRDNISNFFFDLKLHKKKVTEKQFKAYIDCCIENREKLRESADGFIRHKLKEDAWEFFSPSEYWKRMEQENETTV